MKPGFLSLFSRSLYRGSAARLHSLEPDSEEYRRVHEERERFAASTIAFCLQNDDDFLWHFWRKLCCNPRERTPRKKPTVQIEPHRWCDLLLRWEKTLCAVEIKIGAMLDNHQNPSEPAFWEPGGYGDFLAKQCWNQKRKGRDVVFGWEQEIGPWSKKDGLGLDVKQRKWEDLENRLPSSALMEDLTTLLSSFGIGAFTFRAMKNKRLSGKLGYFGSAVAVLESVRDKLGWPASFRVEAKVEEVGIYLRACTKKKAVGGLAERLKQDNGVSQTADVGWFGYLKRENERERRCVYVYSAKDRRKRLVNRLNTAKFVVDERDQDEGGGPYYALVWEGNDKLDDITWFSHVLDAAGGASQHG